MYNKVKNTIINGEEKAEGKGRLVIMEKDLYKYRAEVTRVVDADTFDAIVDLGFGIKATYRFRINDYDAPETWRPSCEAEKIHGKEATARAIELVINKPVILRSTKLPGIYGRYGADIWLEDGRNYVEVMISEGFTKKEDYS
jgi:micrococcal nuclease